MNLDKAPLPRFWYLPRGEKAARRPHRRRSRHRRDPAYFDRLKIDPPAARSRTGSACARRHTVPGHAMTTPRRGYQADGFEMALHLNTGCHDYTPASLEASFTQPARCVRRDLAGPAAPVPNRTHCIIWSDWATQPSSSGRTASASTPTTTSWRSSAAHEVVVGVEPDAVLALELGLRRPIAPGDAVRASESQRLSHVARKVPS